MFNEQGKTDENPAARVGGKLVKADNSAGFVCRTDDGRESADYHAPDGETEGNQCTIVDEQAGQADGGAPADPQG